MRLIDADTALPGLTIVAQTQTAGKGQRNKQWIEDPGSSLLMSLIIKPDCALEEQPAFNAYVAVTIAEVLMQLHEHWQVFIKWPNDLIIGDKKAGGILIENVIRGSHWSHSIIGVGINLYQRSFPQDLSHATSLQIAGGQSFAYHEVFEAIRTELLSNLSQPMNLPAVMDRYNSYLYRKGMLQSFVIGDDTLTFTIEEVDVHGQLVITTDEGETRAFQHGSLLWKWS